MMRGAMKRESLCSLKMKLFLNTVSDDLRASELLARNCAEMWVKPITINTIDNWTSLTSIWGLTSHDNDILSAHTTSVLSFRVTLLLKWQKKCSHGNGCFSSIDDRHVMDLWRSKGGNGHLSTPWLTPTWRTEVTTDPFTSSLFVFMFFIEDLRTLHQQNYLLFICTYHELKNSQIARDGWWYFCIAWLWIWHSDRVF